MDLNTTTAAPQSSTEAWQPLDTSFEAKMRWPVVESALADRGGEKLNGRELGAFFCGYAAAGAHQDHRGHKFLVDRDRLAAVAAALVGSGFTVSQESFAGFSDREQMALAVWTG